jgi:hypothetical protein
MRRAADYRVFNYERDYSEKSDPTDTETNIDNTPVVRRIRAPLLCA